MTIDEGRRTQRVRGFSRPFAPAKPVPQDLARDRVVVAGAPPTTTRNPTAASASGHKTHPPPPSEARWACDPMRPQDGTCVGCEKGRGREEEGQAASFVVGSVLTNTASRKRVEPTRRAELKISLKFLAARLTVDSYNLQNNTHNHTPKTNSHQTIQRLPHPQPPNHPRR